VALILLINFLHIWLAHIIDRNREMPQSKWKVLIAMHRQYWKQTNTETTHQQLLHLGTVIQEHWMMEEKWRFVKSINFWN